jgi:hypothetical protein
VVLGIPESVPVNAVIMGKKAINTSDTLPQGFIEALKNNP